MDKEEELLLESYMEEADIITQCYNTMGRLLDIEQVKKRVEELGIESVYIYGGGYLGIQLYRAIKKLTKIISIVDKSGALLIDLPNVPIIDIESFKENYDGQIVIITPIKHYMNIYIELCEFVSKEKLMLLGQFLGGL